MLIFRIYYFEISIQVFFWSMLKYIDLKVVDINILEIEQLNLKVINNVDFWDFQNRKRLCKIFLQLEIYKVILISIFSFQLWLSLFICILI